MNEKNNLDPVSLRGQIVKYYNLNDIKFGSKQLPRNHFHLMIVTIMKCWVIQIHIAYVFFSQPIYLSLVHFVKTDGERPTPSCCFPLCAMKQCIHELSAWVNGSSSLTLNICRLQTNLEPAVFLVQLIASFATKLITVAQIRHRDPH